MINDGTNNFTTTQITDYAIKNGLISTNLNAFRDTDDILNYNSSFQSILITTNGPTTSAVRAEGQTISIKAVDEKSGYFVAQSQADFLGYNGSSRDQLYLFDRSGKAIAQLTSNAGSDTYSAIDINQGGSKVVFADSGSNSLDVIDISSYGADPTTYSRTTILSSASTNLYNSFAKISNDGAYVFTFRDTGSDVAASLVDVATQTEDSYLAGQTFAYGTTLGGFLESDKVAFYESNSKILKTYTDGDGAFGDELLDLSSETVLGLTLSFYESDTYDSLIAARTSLDIMSSTVNNALILSDAPSNNIIFDFSNSTAELFDSEPFSVMRDSTGGAKLIVNDTLTSVVSDNDQEVYELTLEDVESSTAGTYKKLKQFSKILTRSHLQALDNPAQLYKFAARLEELIDVLKENISVIEGIREYAIQNTNFLRDIGLKVLEASDKSNLSGGNAAEELAKRVRNSISSKGTSALNINDIEGLLAASTLLVDE
ncbi:MAG: hypothetical protein R3A13_10450 [Bdellovibrionota bacterium]